MYKIRLFLEWDKKKKKHQVKLSYSTPSSFMRQECVHSLMRFNMIAHSNEFFLVVTRTCIQCQYIHESQYFNWVDLLLF